MRREPNKPTTTTSWEEEAPARRRRTEGHEAAVGGEAVHVLAAQLRRRDRRPAALGRPRERVPEVLQLLEEGGRDGQVGVVPETHREDGVYPLGLQGMSKHDAEN